MQKQQAQAKVVETQNTPQVQNQTPTTLNNETPNSAPKVNSNRSGVIATITTNRNIIEIDSLGRVAQVTLTQEQYVDEDGKKIQLFSPIQLRPLK